MSMKMMIGVFTIVSEDGIGRGLGGRGGKLGNAYNIECDVSNGNGGGGEKDEEML